MEAHAGYREGVDRACAAQDPKLIPKPPGAPSQKPKSVGPALFEEYERQSKK